MARHEDHGGLVSDRLNTERLPGFLVDGIQQVTDDRSLGRVAGTAVIRDDAVEHPVDAGLRLHQARAVEAGHPVRQAKSEAASVCPTSRW
jgi:hypothetical protein